MRSLFARLFTTQLAAVLVALIALGFSLSYMYTQYIYDLKERELVHIGEQLADEFGGNSFKLIHLNRIRMLLEAAHVYGDARVMVVDATGRVLLTSTPDNRIEGIRFSEEDVQAIFAGGIVRRRTFLSQLAEPAFAVAVPIPMAGSVTGAVILHAPLRGIMHTIQGGRQLIFWAGVLAALLAASVSFLFARRVAGPLQQMRAVALEMAGGDFHRRVQVPGSDEVAELATALNDMANRLDHTIRALGAEKSKTESVIAGLAEGVLAVDTQARILLANKTARRLLTPELLATGNSLEAAASVPLAAALQGAFQRVLSEKKPEHFTLEDRGGALLISVAPVAGPDGQALGAVALLQDVSERQRLEKMRRDFVADVSHELRTPLTSIYGFAQAMLDGVVTRHDQVTRYLRVIMDESLRLVRLTNTLLDLSRMESHNVKLNLAPIRLADVVSDTISSLEPLLADKRVAAVTNIPADLPPVKADADRLAQILLNLLDNAIRHVPEEGQVTVTAAPAEERFVEVTVSDNGPGIPENELRYIWERFYKVDKSRKQNRSGGTGLGLVIVKQLTELHGGSVSVENAAEGGARFTVRLPTSAEEGLTREIPTVV